MTPPGAASGETAGRRGAPPAPGRSLWQDAMARFRRHRAAMASVWIVGVITVLAVLVPEFWPNSLDDVNWDYLESPPTTDNHLWFGTDVNGRDMFSRTFYGARISLAIGVLTTLVALVIGVAYGAIAGYRGGTPGELMMRVVDVLYSLPALFFVIILVTVFGNSFLLIFLCIGAVEWLTLARIVRGQTLSIKEKEYVESARAAGLSMPVILLKYIIPNVIGPVIVYVTLLIPINIIVESYLSFLGLGVQEPYTSWGRLISQGADEIGTAPWLLIIPASFLVITLFCFNFIGDGLRDALDPKDRTR
ncbi:MAG: ABC transporter permease subunit [Gammaproteobacteria bacterium]|nr:ABC transporter permease subunit [Gammaproteobacteria bacterium]